MGRKRGILYEALGGGAHRLGGTSKPRSSTRRKTRGKPRKGAAKGRGVLLGSRPGTTLVVGSVFLVLLGVAYYIGTLDAGKNANPSGLLRRSIDGGESDPAPAKEPPRTVLRKYWTLQVISYPNTAKGRGRAERMMDELILTGFPDVHGLESDASGMIGVAVGRHERRETLDNLRDQIQDLKIRGKRPFKSAYPRLVELPE